MRASLRLFRALPIASKRKKNPSKKLLEKTIQKGFMFSPEVVYNYPEVELIDLVDRIESITGITPEQMNSSFHKSWAKIRNSSIEQLFLEQMIHYFTTYGFETLGIYDQDSVYIPNEELSIPDIPFDKVKLVIIHGYTKKELKEKLLGLLRAGIALSEDTVKDACDLAMWLEFGLPEVESIRNKEVKIALYNYLDMVPSDPIEFLRYLIFEVTGETLLIKSKELITKISESPAISAVKLFKKYSEAWSLERLAEIFYRFKPLFLAFRSVENPVLNKKINKIRKLAKNYHKPMRRNFLNEVTAVLKKDKLFPGFLEGELERVPIFRKIRLAYALKFRTVDCDSILYRIRNGKSYATDFVFDNKEGAQEALDEVIVSIANDIRPNVEGKRIYIPEMTHYTLPATEKQFVGMFPSGSYISVDQHMIIGVNWKNLKEGRVDLDLKIQSASKMFGWDAAYRNQESSILFSGDITDALGENGATELFYIKRQQGCDAYNIFLNFFNMVDFDKGISVPFKIIIAKEEIEDLDHNYMINPNNVLTVVNTSMKEQQIMLGLLVIKDAESRFYFSSVSLGKGRTLKNSTYVEHARKFLAHSFENTIGLEGILAQAGARITTEKEGCDIDLTPESLEKDTIINLLRAS